MSEIRHPGFARVVRGLGADIEATTPTSVDLLFDDIPVRVHLHPDGRQVLVDAFVLDASGFYGLARTEVVEILLRLNALALQGKPFVAGLTPTGLVAICVRASLEDADNGGIADILDFTLRQAGNVRDLVTAITAVDIDRGVTLYDA